MKPKVPVINVSIRPWSHGLSPETRRGPSAAYKKPTPGAKAIPAKKKRAMSPAAKAKLSALAKARWAKIKAGGKKSL
jgi:hypothetical protein